MKSPRLKWTGCFLWLILCSLTLAGQHDTLVFKNGDQVVGEIKSMDRGVLVVETDYSDSDFKIKWIDVKEVHAESRFLINLKRGGRVHGRLQTQAQTDTLTIYTDEDETLAIYLPDIVYLKGLKSAFWNRVNASIDLGLKVTKANNLRQLSVQSAIGYLADKWSTDMYYDDLSSSQDSISDTRRKDGGINYRFFLPHDWYAFPEVTYLSNTEQALKSRVTTKLGAGRFFVRSNKAYWGASGGISVLRERFTNDTESRTSSELFVGTELNFFDVGDINLLTNFTVYPSLTETNRIRSDFKLDVKYDFLSDFYVKFNFTLNYDNQPAVVGKDTDYIYGVSFGWEL